MLKYTRNEYTAHDLPCLIFDNIRILHTKRMKEEKTCHSKGS